MGVMTLLQLKYIVKIVECGSMNEASHELYVSQPALSSSVKELENELGIEIFTRSSQGIALTVDGAEFLTYARQVLDQASLLEERYKNAKPRKQLCSVSTQHYMFAVEAFVEMIDSTKSDEYEFTIRETRTKDIINQVANMLSEIGIIYLSDFNKDEYLNDLPDMDNLSGQAAPAAGASQESQNNGDSAASATSDSADSAATAANAASSESQENGDAADGATQDGEDTLTPLGQAKKEAAEYLEALQRERAEFINFRNRSQKEQERFRQHGIIDVLTALLPALDDIDRIREHSEMDDSFKAVANKIDKAFEKFGVEKFGEKGEDFDPTKHDAILHKPDPNAEKETVDTVVEAGYRIGDRVIRAARVVVASPQN